MRVQSGGDPSIASPVRSPRRYLSLEWVVLCAALLTALAFYFREPLTTRQLSLGPAEAGTAYDSYFYGDESNGGNSVARSAPGRPLAWSCDLATAIEYAY